jgi:phosphoribosylamine--glycine ligase
MPWCSTPAPSWPTACRTSGGRVLCVTALADSVKQAQQRAYDVARGIHFDGAQYRRDIGHRAIKTP